MEFPADLIPQAWLRGGTALYLLVLVVALVRAPWHYLKDSSDANVLIGSCVVLWVMWQFRGGIDVWPGLGFHLLLATSVTLMFGWAFAFVVTSVAQVLLVLQGEAAWPGYGLYVLCNHGAAIATTYFVHRIAHARLPRHFFVYIFVSCFFGAAMAMLVSRLVGMAVILLSGAYTLGDLQSAEFFVLLPLMMFPEAFLNGMVMTLIVTYRPQWASSFLDRHYLKGK